MTVSYEKNKKFIYNWRANHHDRLNELGRKYAKTQYAKECYYSYEKYCKQLRKIVY